MMDLEKQRPPANGWTRLWIIATVLWAIQALGLSAIIVLGALKKAGSFHLDLKNVAAMLGMAAVYLIIPPILAWWTGRGIARLASGKNPFRFGKLSRPRKAWFILAAALYLIAFLPGIAGLLFWPTTMAASAASAPFGGDAATKGLIFALAALPQWLVYTLASYLLMRLMEWVLSGFN